MNWSHAVGQPPRHTTGSSNLKSANYGPTFLRKRGPAPHICNQNPKCFTPRGAQTKEIRYVAVWARGPKTRSHLKHPSGTTFCRKGRAHAHFRSPPATAPATHTLRVAGGRLFLDSCGSVRRKYREELLRGSMRRTREKKHSEIFAQCAGNIENWCPGD